METREQGKVGLGTSLIEYHLESHVMIDLRRVIRLLLS